MKRLHRRECLCYCVGLLFLTACHQETRKPTITVAAAANLTQVFDQLGPRFEAETGIHPVFSFGSTAQLTRQIENAAPFDAFTAADSTHLGELESKGLLVAGTRAIYARGVLALWLPDAAVPVKDVRDVVSPQIRVIAIAKPELAPYGQAAVDSLTHLGIWQQVQPKVVYAENIDMARQYGKSKNADAVFTAYSLVLHESGRVLRIDESLHQPINQELGVLAKSSHQDEARKFTAFLLTGNGRAILASFGYNRP